ncbi:MAG: MATE family efflux transporter [Lachnospiraceae bacterium]|nr:MATE family efflux transporter [Lachnospiraceae bacterium]
MSETTNKTANKIAKTNIKNMTVGDPMKLIVAYFLPVLGSTIFQQLYGIVDSIIVGKGIDDYALAAVGNTGSIMFFIFGFVMGLASGMSVLMAQAFGAKDYDRLKKTITMGFLACGIVTISIMVLSLIFIGDILLLLKTPEEIMAQSRLYIVIILVGLPLTFLYNCSSAMLNSLGDSKTPLGAVILASAINVVLDILFIFVCKMGVEGAAIGTLIAQLFSLIFNFVHLRKISYIKLKRSDFELDFGLIFNVIKIGVPVAFMNSITAIGCLLLQYFVNDLGIICTSAYSACMRISQFLVQPSTAVGITINTYAGQNYGAKRIDRIKNGINSALMLSLIITAIGSVLLIFAPKMLASIMLTDSEIIDVAAGYLVIRGVMHWSICLLFLYRGTLQGMGFTFVPMISGILELLARVVVSVLLVKRMGFDAIALAEVSAFFSALALNYIYLQFRLRGLEKG